MAYHRLAWLRLARLRLAWLTTTGAVLFLLTVPLFAQPYSAQIQRAIRGLTSGTTLLTTPTIIGTGYLGFATGTSHTGTVPTGVDQLLAKEAESVLAHRGQTLTEFRWYASKTDTNNYTRVRLQTANAGGFSTLQTQTTTSGSNAVSAGMCIGTNNNTTNRWCVGGATAGAGSLFQGATPNVIYAISTPTIAAHFGSGSSDTIETGSKGSSFALIVGTSPDTQATVNFGTTFTNIPSCECTNTITNNPVQCVPTTTQAVLNAVVVASDIIRCTALGH